ncbi:hypothetical protein SAMN05216404_106137 [Nitrosospira multiformis]|uniref:Uncharacterized protein n=1 Tax=Nitrosospira multiformis TaxID=1231 RepID=A0A1H8IR08_9PROT|nr:hypothetical protein SAMN05216404_106137 [Nitrosospira multiformis]
MRPFLFDEHYFLSQETEDVREIGRGEGAG